MPTTLDHQHPSESNRPSTGSAKTGIINTTSKTTIANNQQQHQQQKQESTQRESLNSRQQRNRRGKSSAESATVLILDPPLNHKIVFDRAVKQAATLKLEASDAAGINTILYIGSLCSTLYTRFEVRSTCRACYCLYRAVSVWRHVTMLPCIGSLMAVHALWVRCS